MSVHRLKVEQPHFQALWDGSKTFEIRWDDRGYAVGDQLILMEWDGQRETGEGLTAKVTHLLRGGQHGLAEGWVVMSLGGDGVMQPARWYLAELLAAASTSG